MGSQPVAGSQETGRTVVNGSRALDRGERVTILQAAGLVAAPRARRRAFWQSYNLAKRRRFAGLGETATRIVADARKGRSSGPDSDRAQAAWLDVVPKEFARRTWIEDLHRGVLTICVQDSATRFAVERMMANDLLSSLRASLGAHRVRRIRCRLAAPEGRCDVFMAPDESE